MRPYANHVVLSLFSLLMVYPLIWLVSGSFKTNFELFSSLRLIPQEIQWDAYVKGWNGTGQFTYGNFFANTFLLVVPTVIFTVISSGIVAYGFARFRFRLRDFLFMLMLSTLMLPDAVVMIPRYLIFRNFGWLDSYYPFIIPALFACAPFFVFMFVQFFRGIPRELDESAKIDGCSPIGILIRVLLPLCKPAIFSAFIFQFIWTWNDFFNPLIYINSVSKYPVSLALRMGIDSTGGTMHWNQILAMSALAMVPPTLIFFLAQRYFVEGIATTGIKG